MATVRQRTGQVDFLHEPSYPPPTIPPHMTVADYRRRRAQRARRPRRRRRRR